jgi:hydrogenase maturation factor
MTLVVGRIVRLQDSTDGRWALLSVRGACLEVAADLVPALAVGDQVLVEAGVVIGRIDDPAADGEEDPEWAEDETCA